MRKIILLLSFVFLVCIHSYSQKDDLIKYLDAYKTAEFEESKEVIKNYSFGKNPEYTMMDYSSVNGIDFATDIDSIKGYKAIVNCQLQNKAGSYTDKKMLAIMYLNKENNLWSVHIFRDVCEPLKEYNLLKTKVDAGDFYTNKQYVYRNLVYWSIASGKLNEAVNYMTLAEHYASESGDNKFSMFDDLDLLRKIIRGK